jgi:hypothetical protein
MPKNRARRYSIEIKDAKGSILFSTVAYWDDKDRRIAIAQITRLAELPEVNFHAEPALEPETAKAKRSLLDRGQRHRGRRHVDLRRR